MLGLWRSIAVGDGATIVVFSFLLTGTALIGAMRAAEYREART
jgi:hypothetical protein